MEPKERGTFDQIETELTAELAEDLRELPCHMYYQFVPIHVTEIGGVVKDCGLRTEDNSTRNDLLTWNVAPNEMEDKVRQKRRFSY